MWTLDWNSIIVAIGAIVAFLIAVRGILGRLQKLADDSAQAAALLKELLISFTDLFDELRAANADGTISQDEYDILMKDGDDIMDEIKAVIAQGKVLEDDIASIKASIDALIASWKK